MKGHSRSAAAEKEEMSLAPSPPHRTLIIPLVVLVSILAAAYHLGVLDEYLAQLFITDVGDEEDLPSSSPVPSSSSPRVQITHIFSAYMPKSPTTQLELELVKQSWKVALDTAKLNNITVELVTAILPHNPDDVIAIPAFARRLSDLTWQAPGPEGGVFPAIGEIFQKAHREGKGEYVVYTNADIGVQPNFYSSIVKLIKQDPTHFKSVKYSVESAFRFLGYCTKHRAPTADTFEWNRLCFDDAELVFENDGGLPGFFPKKEYEQLFMMTSGGSTIDDVTNKVHAAISASKNTTLLLPLAATITRLDLIDVMVNSTTVSALTAWTRLARHPGNDCFLVKRNNIPKEVLNLFHPVGYRPWGTWLQDSFSRTSRFRRISSTVARRFTFHIGKGLFGHEADDWKGHFQRNPMWVLFVASNWFALTRGRYGDRFVDDADGRCNTKLRDSHVAFCANAPFGSYCQGASPLSCATKVRSDARDGRIYQSICSHRGMQTGEPGCSFCRFILRKAKSPPASVLPVCTAEKMSPFCTTQPDVCDYDEPLLEEYVVKE